MVKVPIKYLIKLFSSFQSKNTGNSTLFIKSLIYIETTVLAEEDHAGLPPQHPIDQDV